MIIILHGVISFLMSAKLCMSNIFQLVILRNVNMKVRLGHKATLSTGPNS